MPCKQVDAVVMGASPIDAKVAIIASGGLSHFLCEAAFDRQTIDAIKNRDKVTLTSIPQQSLCSGSSEIRNWITVAGAIGELECIGGFIDVSMLDSAIVTMGWIVSNLLIAGHVSVPSSFPEWMSVMECAAAPEVFASAGRTHAVV
ncbi:hypothetical protein [Paraburkholderia kururiensis]|uniref:hypothetical protein n=1 Tax=Paraburkholderia kururiensis TaxID=984307 RepID=UPI00034D13CA|nr:hypothetical protein [Paraburkholderia kururiensis]